mmetsp:Transcript_29152/g.56012  ORF Transcript_29152/g.56012 Transcript_29152/m.56012 type:complete len:234 (-) Transcript_29152:669-1370(-)
MAQLEGAAKLMLLRLGHVHHLGGKHVCSSDEHEPGVSQVGARKHPRVGVHGDDAHCGAALHIRSRHSGAGLAQHVGSQRLTASDCVQALGHEGARELPRVDAHGAPHVHAVRHAHHVHPVLLDVEVGIFSSVPNLPSQHGARAILHLGRVRQGGGGVVHREAGRFRAVGRGVAGHGQGLGESELALARAAVVPPLERGPALQRRVLAHLPQPGVRVQGHGHRPRAHVRHLNLL